MLTKLLANVMRKTVFVCSGAAAAYLFLVSILSTCNLGNSQNSGTHVFFRADYPMMHLLVIFALMGLIFWIRKMPAGGNYDKAAALVIGGWGLAAVLWVLCFMEQPEHDPANVLRAARQMRQYNFSSFTGEGYLNIWAGNRNLALFFYLLSFLIGVDNYVLLRLLNVAAVVVIFLLIYKIVGEAWEKGKRTAFWSVFLCACFAPIFLYTTFIYGDIYGLCLAMAAVFAQLKCFGGGYKLKWLVLSAVCIAVAVLLKMNYLIVLIAMAAAIVYDMFLNKNWKKALFYFAVLIISISGLKMGSNVLLKSIVGSEWSDGVPYEAWFAMGMQEGVRAAGNYNGYNREVYMNNGYDSQKTKEEAQENVKESLHAFMDDPGYALDFFVQKTASQWNNPSCGALSNSGEKESGSSWMANSVQAGGGRVVLNYFLNLFQTWILLGVVCYLALEKDKSDFEWIFLLIFLGGFFFHMLWEAGARYAFPYYLLLIPYGGMGLSLLERKLERAIGKKRDKKDFRWKCRLGGIGVCILVMAAVLPYSNLLGRLAPVYAEEEWKMPAHIEDGYYNILPAEDSGLYLTEIDGKIILMNGENILQEVSIFRSDETYKIRFMPSQNTIELAGGEAVIPKNEEYAFGWQIRPAGKENEYYILMNNETALGYSLEDWSVKLEKFEEGNRMQVWTIQ